MALRSDSPPNYLRGVRRVLIGTFAVLLIGLFLLWRIDNARVEQFRIDLVDRFVPGFEWTTKPVAHVARMIADLRAYGRIYEQNTELRRELQRMQGWREAALQLEQKNAKLLALNRVRLNPRLTFVTAEVLADSGSPFRNSAMVNVGRIDGVEDGWAAMDGLGLVGRVAGVGERSSRIILVTDASSRVPVTIRPSGQRAMVSGDNTPSPTLEFLDQGDELRPGDRVVSSGDGGLYPPDILIGQVFTGKDGRARVRLAADTRRLEFVRVVRSVPPAVVEGPGGLIGPLRPATPAAVGSVSE
ncbi:rod shape-determining protein MreC [Amaricoccus macauensis]|uniref:Cell shape-determining protein MreC n=1 Tax=Amaricoccus macauensis TaxID=57001 RepID=A0A840SX56_9RHOB|nr:rod shape-determining protein MreC [Amaricoccus macauensis]